MKYTKIFQYTLLTTTLTALAATSNLSLAATDELVVYSSRKEHLIRPLLMQFQKETGIKTTLYTGKANALIQRLKSEGSKTPADIFMTVDAGNLWYAAKQGLFQPMNMQQIEKNIPNHLRDPNNLWTGLSVRARTIFYNQNKVSPKELSTYEALADPSWRGRLCLRTSKKVYNKSLVAAMIAHHGEAKTKQVLQGWVKNLATKPHAKDSHVLKAIEAGQCDVGIVNTYYYGRMADKNPHTAVRLFWANQNTTGTHINISGAGILKHSDNPAAAQKLINWLTQPKPQKHLSTENKEYPANPHVKVDAQLLEWGDFKQDTLNMSKLGENQAKAVQLMQAVGYK